MSLQAVCNQSLKQWHPMALGDKKTPAVVQTLVPWFRVFICIKGNTFPAPCFYRSIRPATWRPALRCAATPPGPPGCQSTSVKMGRGRNRDSDTPVGHCSLTPSSSSWARKRWRRGSAPTTALQPARLTVSAGNEPPTTHFLLCSVVSKLSQVFLVLSAASTCS